MYEIRNNSKTTKHISCQILFMILASLLIPILVVDAAPVENHEGVMEFLSKYGYLEQSSTEKNSDFSEIRDLSSAIKDYQSFVGIEVTGQADKNTLEMMSIPRCGSSDKHRLSDTHNRLKRHTIVDSFWTNKTLNYAIAKYPKKLDRRVVDTEIRNAFKVWSEYTDLSFSATETEPIDIEIKFLEGAHGCNQSFDGPDNILAHAYFPHSGGRVHFDDSEQWTVDINSSPNTIGLFQVAIHEFGHALGLAHSQDNSAIMAPGYDPLKTRLASDDILGIETIYGINKNRINASKVICRDPKIDTIFYSPDNQMYAFKGQLYYKIQEYSDALGYPKKISETWRNLPDDIDAAFTYKDNKTYFFKGTMYWKYSGQQVDSGYPKEISEDFPGVPNHLDTAWYWLGNTKIYFFKGSKVWLFDTLEEKVTSGYPKLISEKWERLPSDLDAAIQRKNGYIAFFKGNKHYRIKNRESSVDANYPIQSGGFLFNCADP